MGKKFALIIGNSEYEDSTLSRLITPDFDVEALAEVLRDQRLGQFDDVQILVNQDSPTIRRAITQFFSSRAREDLLLLYFSGHGVLDERGRLFLAAHDTERELLRGTAIGARFVTDEMDNSRSWRQVLILDCCHSGAFSRGAKAVRGSSVGTAEIFEGTGYGRVVLTASDATQYAWEGNEIIGEADKSVFTHFFIQGIQTGAADANHDGNISVDEIFEYVYENIARETPRQTPGKWSYKGKGQIVLAQNPFVQKKEQKLPKALFHALDSPLANVRKGAALELGNLLEASDPELAAAAEKALLDLINDDSREVTSTVARILKTREVGQKSKPEAQGAEAQQERAQGLLDPATEPETAADVVEQFHQAATVVPEAAQRLPLLGNKRILSLLLGLFLLVGMVIVGIFVLNSRPVTTTPESIVEIKSPLKGPTVTQPAPTHQPTLTSALTPSPAPTAVPISTLQLPVLPGTTVPMPEEAINLSNLTRLEQLARWGLGGIQEVSWDQNGDYFAIATALGLHIFEAATRVQIATVDFDTVVLSLSFAPDSTTIAVGLSDHSIRLLDVEDGAAQNLFSGHSDEVRAIAFSPDGQILASGSDDQTVRLWNALDGTSLLVIRGFTEEVHALSFSPDGKFVASASGDRATRVHRISDGQLLWRADSASEVNDIEFSPDGSLLATASKDGTIRLYNSANGAYLRRLSGTHSGAVLSLSFSPDSQRLASGAVDARHIIWSVANSSVMQVFEGHQSWVVSVDFSPDGSALMTGSEDGTVKFWPVVGDSSPDTINGYMGLIRSLAFSPDGTRIASGTRDGLVRLWEVSTGTVQQRLEGHTSSVTSLTFTSDGEHLVTGSDDMTVRYWQIDPGSTLFEMTGHSRLVESIDLSPAGDVVASGDFGGSIMLWRVADGERVTSLGGHSQPVWAVAFSPDGSQLASGSIDGTIRLWKYPEGNLLRRLVNPSGSAVFSLAYSPDGTSIAGGTADGAVILWEVSSGEQIYRAVGHEDQIWGLAFSPDGSLLASGSLDKSIRIWDAGTGRHLHTLEGHTLALVGVRFSPDGRLLASFSWDGTIRIWGLPVNED